MTSKALLAASIWHDEVDLSGVSNTLNVPTNADVLDKTTFASANWRDKTAGLLMGNITVGGFYDTAGTDLELWDAVGTAGILTVAVDTASGDVAYFAPTVGGTHTWGESVGQLAKADTDWETNGILTRGKVLEPKAVQSSTAAGTAIQVGAVSAAQSIYAHLHVFAVTGGGTLTVRLQSDTAEGFPSTTTQGTFTDATAATSERLIVAGAITDTWWRGDWTLTAGTATFGLVAGIA